MIKVYILDNHPIVVRGMRLILSKEEDIELAGEAASYMNGRRYYRRYRNELVKR